MLPSAVPFCCLLCSVLAVSLFVLSALCLPGEWLEEEDTQVLIHSNTLPADVPFCSHAVVTLELCLNKEGSMVSTNRRDCSRLLLSVQFFCLSFLLFFLPFLPFCFSILRGPCAAVTGALSSLIFMQNMFLPPPLCRFLPFLSFYWLFFLFFFPHFIFVSSCKAWWSTILHFIRSRQCYEC